MSLCTILFRCTIFIKWMVLTIVQPSDEVPHVLLDLRLSQLLLSLDEGVEFEALGAPFEQFPIGAIVHN